MDAITAALLQQYGVGGARQSPLLLNPAPALAGLRPGAAIQTNTPQPVLPQPGVPAAPKNNQPNNAAMNLLSAIRGQQGRSGGGQGTQLSGAGAGTPLAPGGLSNTMLGRLINTGTTNPDYVGVTPNQVTGMGGNMGYIGNLLHGGNILGNWGSLF